MDRSNRQARTPGSTFAALASRNYRLYWLGLVCYVLGHRAEYVTFAWMVWELTREPIFLGYLGLAQGVSLPQYQDRNRASLIFEWDGTRFEPFQEIPSQWAYNWHHIQLAGQHYLAHADNRDPSRLYRWDGARFVEHQTLVETEGRAFAEFTVDGDTYLACAVLGGDSQLLRWNGQRFVPYQVLPGAGGREFAVVHSGEHLYLVRVNFLTGTRENPTTSLDSLVYQWIDGKLEVVERFPTSGGTDVAVYPDGAETFVAVSNSLTADVKFSTETVVYSFTG